MERPPPWWFVVVVAIAGAAACGTPQLPWSTVSDPLVADGRLVFTDDAAGEVLVLDALPETFGQVRRHHVDGAIDAAALLDGEEEVLVLSAEAGTLTRVPLAAAGTTEDVEVGGRYERLSLSPDEGLAVCWRPSADQGAIFTNPNELALVDLAGELTEGSVTSWTVASLGGEPTRVVVSDPLPAARYVATLSRDHVSILQLAGAAPTERSVPLTNLADPATRTPVSAVFAADPDGVTAWALVVTNSGQAAYALHLIPGAGGDFDVVVSQVAGVSPSGPAALAALPDVGLVAVLLQTTTRTLTRTILATGVGIDVPLGADADSLELLDGHRALVVGSDQTGAFHVVDLVAMATQKAKSVRSRFVGTAVDAVVEVAEHDLFVALQSDGGVSVVEAEADRVTTFTDTGDVRGWELADGALHLLTHLGGANDAWLVQVDLESLHPEAAQIPGPAEVLFRIGGTPALGTASTWDGGTLTLWPSGVDAGDESEVWVHPAFLLGGLFDRSGGGWP